MFKRISKLALKRFKFFLIHRDTPARLDWNFKPQPPFDFGGTKI